jgi:hypothetical protein
MSTGIRIVCPSRASTRAGGERRRELAHLVVD